MPLWSVEALYDFYGEAQGVRMARKHVQWYAEKLDARRLLDCRCNEALTPSMQLNWVRILFEKIADGKRSDA